MRQPSADEAGNYEPSVYRRSEGRWVAAVSLGDGERSLPAVDAIRSSAKL
jgi:hypothetical protein